MKTRGKFKYCALILISFLSCFFASELYSQNYVVQTYTQEEGLPNLNVHWIFQGNLGRIWFGTKNGITVYDGLDWIYYTTDNGLPDNEIFCIREDSNERMWCITNRNDFKISYLNGQRWIPVESPKFEENKIPFARTFDVIAKKNSFQILVSSNRSGLFYFNSGKWKNLTVADGLPSNSATNIENSENKFYVATKKGIVIIDDGKIDLSLNRLIPKDFEEVLSIKFETVGNINRLWLLSSNGIGYIENNKFYIVNDKLNTRDNSAGECVQFIPDYYGWSIFGNQFGLRFLNKKTGEVMTMSEQSGLRILNPYSILKDREWNVWFGGRNGVNKLRSMRFATYRQRSGLLKDEVSSITERNGEMIFGHINGLSILNNKKFILKKFGEDSNYYENNKVLDLCTDNNKNVWFAVEQLGLGKLDINNNIIWYKDFKGAEERVNSVVCDNFNRIFVLSASALYELQNGLFKKIKIPDTEPKTYFRKLFVSADNKIYIASSNNGIVIKDGVNYKTIRSGVNKKYNSVYAILFDDNGEILAGTLNGIVKVKGDSLQKYNLSPLIENTAVYFIQKDRSGQYWIGTDRGVVRWKNNNGVAYSIRDGLAGMEANRDAGYLDSEGRFWIGTDRGVSKYQKEFDFKPHILPEILIESVEPKIGIIRPSQAIEPASNSSSLVFRVKVMSMIDERHNKFSYKLEGFDKDWNYGSARDPLIKYANLSPGSYRLIIKGQNAEGTWGNVVVFGKIKVPMPFYEAWWFYAVVIISFGLIAFGFVMYRINANYAAKLESEVFKRTEIINESERRYRQMFENNQSNMILVDAESLDIVDANEAALKFYGYDANEIIKMNYSKLSTGASIKEISQMIKKHINDRTYYLSKHTLSNGEELYVEISFSEIEVHGRKLFYGIIHDVTERTNAEAGLIESEEKYRTLIESMIDGVYMVQDSKLVFVNNTLVNLLGYQVEDMVGKPFVKFVAPADRDAVTERYLARIAGKNVVDQYELSLLHSDGKTLMRFLIHPILLTYKGRNAVLGTAKNLTESRIQELKLKQFYTAIEQAPVAVMITDINDNIEYVNPMFCRMTGYDHQEIIGQKPFILYAHENTGVETRIRIEVKKGKVWSGEILNKRKNGSKFWVMATISPIRDAEGKITHFISVEQDITFEKYAHEEINRNEKLLSSVISHAPIIIAAIDRRGYVTLARGKELENLGFSNEQSIGISVRDLLKDDSELLDDVDRAISGETFSVIRNLKNKYYEIHCNPIFDENNDLTGSIIVASDISERYETEQKLIAAKEEAERSDRLKSDFLAQMSHEIRTPVNTILSFSSLLEQETKHYISDELKEIFNYIDDGGRRLIRTIDMILNMSQFQTNTYRPMMQSVDLDKEILSKITSELRTTANRKDLELNYVVNTQSTSIVGDSYTVGQIFINLIDNAIKYTHNGKIDVVVKQNGKKIICEVKDTGIGISGEFIPHLFSAFSQEETGYTRRFDGTGLGLALVKKYAEINNAEIKVESVKGKGTKFIVEFKYISQSE